MTVPPLAVKTIEKFVAGSIETWRAPRLQAKTAATRRRPPDYFDGLRPA
jgi:hypothetical protein